MPILHKNITLEADIHNPKWFTPANNGDKPWKNELGTLESTDELVLPSALDFVDASATPPTTNAGDIYVLSSGAVDPSWGAVSTFDWVRYDGTDWNSITPQKSTLCYNKTTDKLVSFSGTAWVDIGGGIPSVTTAEKSALTPSTGDFVYDTDLKSLQRYSGSLWVDIAKGYGLVSVSGSLGEPTYYSDLASAYSAAISGQVVKLHTDVTETGNVEITLTDGVTLDLNGFSYIHTGTGTADCFSATSGSGIIVIKNGRIIKSGSANGLVINNTATYEWVLTGLNCENVLGACLLLKGDINAKGSSFIGNTSGNATDISVTSNLEGGSFYNTGTGTNSLSGDTAKDVLFSAVSGIGCSVSSKTINGIFISTSGTGVATTGSDVLLKDCIAFSDSGTAADLNAGNADGVFAISNTGRGIDAAGCDRLLNSTGISGGNNIGIFTANYNFNCYAESESNWAWATSQTGDKIHNCGGKVNTGNNSAVLCNTSSTEVFFCTLEVASATAYGISGAAAYATINVIKGTALTTQAASLWTTGFDAANNTAQV